MWCCSVSCKQCWHQRILTVVIDMFCAPPVFSDPSRVRLLMAYYKGLCLAVTTGMSASVTMPGGAATTAGTALVTGIAV